ncbi:MAG: hypothetical protein JWO82_2141 [Akkermansiaceae bacterium]|nr:hypothetical protein [Akkermansiaceae bacterium]
MADEKPEKKRGGCLRKLVALFTLAGVAGLGWCVWMIFQPQDLSDIKGRGPAAAGKRAGDLMAVLKKSQEGSYAVNLNEEDINLYLKERLVLKQGGFLSNFVKLESVVVRITKERAEVVMERSIFGHPFTVSMYLHVEAVREVTGRTSREVIMDGGEYFKDFPRLKRGGRFGKLEVPQGFLVLVLPAYRNLAKALDQEISAGVADMPRVNLKNGNVQLDPREEGDEKPLGKF